MRTKALCILLAAFLLLSLAACAAKPAAPAGEATPAPAGTPSEAPVTPEPTQEPTPEPAPEAGGETEPAAPETVENGGLTLSIPAGYSELLIVETPENDENGRLFSVWEKASFEAARAQGFEGGRLFGIGRIGEEKLHELLCYDMSGQEVFARDGEGNYYVYYHPTDVQFVRDSYEGVGDETNADWQQWAMLNEWASGSVRDVFREENGLTAYRRGNSLAESFLARAAYLEGAKYTVSTLEFGPLSPEGVDAAPYVERLLEGLTLEEADLSETPDGEYAVVYFPEEDIRLDFFFADGSYIRQTWAGVDELLYKASYADGETVASEVVREWYDAIASAHGLRSGEDGTYDPLLGVWADSIAGRAMITVSKDAPQGPYRVEVRWSGSAWETAFWNMTAAPGEDGKSLRYEDCTHSVVTFSGEDGTEETWETLYENGTGAFLLSDADELTWQDDEENAADGMVFIRAGRELTAEAPEQ